MNLAPKPLFESAATAKPPEFGNENSAIQLSNGAEPLQVGDDSANALAYFAKPPKAYELRDLPSTLGADFKSQGWETEVEGFGVISYKGQVALAMRLLHKVDEARIQSEIATIQGRMQTPPEPIDGKRSRYWFWESGQHRQMVCAVAEGKDAFMLTIAIGELNTMNALRMNPILAKSDAKRADRAPVATESK